MNYYHITGFVSNSDLNALRNAINVAEPIPDLQRHYDFGNLVDAAATEQHRITGNVLDVESGGLVTFEAERIQTAQKMADAFRADTVLAYLFRNARTQHAYFRNKFEIEHEGYCFTMPVKCKLDLEKPRILGGDIKSTACKTPQAFRESILHFNYDQQGAWYMDIARLDRLYLIGLGKTAIRDKHQVYTHLITRGDEYYNSGKAKYSALAFKHHFLLSNFQ